MTDDLVKRLLNAPADGLGTENLSVEAAARIEALKAHYEILWETNLRIGIERDRLREALAMIDAIDPEHHIDGCAQTVVRGLVLRMGEISRAALKGETP